MSIGRSHSTNNGASACGGRFRDHNSSFITSFYYKVSSNRSIFAEMWVLRSGIILACDLHIQKIHLKQTIFLSSI